MGLWYSKVKSYGRGGTGVSKRKVNLEGWMDDVRVAAYIIGDFFSHKDELEEIRTQFSSFEQMDEDGDYALSDSLEDVGLSFSEEGVGIVSEEFISGVGRTVQLASKLFDEAQESVEGDMYDEWDESLTIPNRPAEVTNDTEVKDALAGYMARKPFRFKDAKEIPSEIVLDINMMADIPEFSDEEVFGGTMVADDYAVQNDFLGDMPNIFYLKLSDGGIYIVNTEGADYTRYLGYIGTSMPVPDETESLQIMPRDDLKMEVKAGSRRPDRPLKRHAETAEKFLEVQRALEELDQQAAAIRAVMAEKQKVAGNLSSELLQYAEEYQDRMFRTENILIQLKDIPPHKAKIPQWRKVIDHLLDKLGAVSTDMRNEAEEFIEASKREIPGSTELYYQEVESARNAIMGEGWVGFRKLLDKIKEMGRRIGSKISGIEKEANDLLAKIGGAKPATA